MSYKITPPEALQDRADLYTSRISPAIRQALSGLPENVMSLILEDYRAVFTGSLDVRASLDIITNALKKLSPLQAFQIDRYGLYYAFRTYYATIVKVYAEFEERMKNILFSDSEEKKKYLSRTADYSLVERRALSWLINKGCIKLTDFEGIDAADISRFNDEANTFADLYDYLIYFSIAKSCLIATPAELAKIEAPERAARLIEVEDTFSFADAYSISIEGYLQNTAAMFARTAEAEAKREHEQAAEQAQALQQAVEGKDPVRLPTQIGSILSRDVFFTPDSKNTEHIQPIQAEIDRYIKKHPEKIGQTTPRMVEKAIEGVSLLQRWHKVTPVNGLYSYETTLNELSTACNIKSANQEERAQLLQALEVLDGLYLIGWGAKGRQAVRCLSIRKIIDADEREGHYGKIMLDIPVETMGDRPIMIDAKGFESLRGNAKGSAKNHFRNQILIKGHKDEETLIKEIFGYYTLLFETTNGTGDETTYASEVAKFKLYWNKNKSAFKKKIAKWFKEYADLGAITYTYKQNKKGEYIYSWEKAELLNPKTEEQK